MTISIIAPVYNVSSYLDQFILSVTNQTYSDFELLLVTDKPTDSSIEICQRYAQEDQRIHVLEQPTNMGVAKARNRGLREAQGDYLMLADSDDYLAPCALQDSLTLLMDSQTDIAYCGYWTDCDGNIQQKRFRFSKGRYSHNQAVTEHLNLHTLYGYPWGKLFRKEVLKDVWDPEDMSCGDDGVFSYRALYNAKRGVAFTDKPIYYYRIRQDSLTQHGQGFRARDLEILKQVQYVREWTKDEGFEYPLDVFEFISYTGMMQKYLTAETAVRNEFAEEFMTMKTACDSTWKSCLLHAKNPAFRLRALRYSLRGLDSLR